MIYSSFDLSEIPEVEPIIIIGNSTEPPSYVNDRDLVELNLSSELPDPITCSGSLTISPPSFDLLFEAVDRILDGVVDVTTFSSPPHSNTQTIVSNITPYRYSKTNLILFVEEGQSMYDKLIDDIRYYRKSVTNEDGLPKNQLHLLDEFTGPTPSFSYSKGS